MPVRFKYWQQEDLWNGKYTITDFFNILDVIADEETRKIQVEAAMRGLGALGA